MNKRIVALILFALILISGYVPIATAHNAPFPSEYDPTKVNIDTIAEPESLDPAWAYDTESENIIGNVYETLVSFSTNYTAGPYSAGSVGQFVPWLAIAVPTEFDLTGLPPEKAAKMTFFLRSGPTFSDGNSVTAEDVEYSFERMLVQDRDGGPQWMLYYPLLYAYGASSPTEDSNFGAKINSAIESDPVDRTVTFYFDNPTPLSTWLQILSQPWSSIVEKQWAIGLGDFDGNWAHTWQYIWDTWHNPSSSFLDFPNADMRGSGPYKFSYWNHGSAISIIENENYWGGWHAKADKSQKFTKQGLGTFSQTYLKNWTNWCAPTAAGISLFYWGDRGFEKFKATDDTEKARIIEELGRNYMETNAHPPLKGTRYCDQVNGLIKYIKDKGYEKTLKVTYYATNLGGLDNTKKPTFDDYANELGACEDVLVSIKLENGEGHTLTGFKFDRTNHAVSFSDPAENDYIDTYMMENPYKKGEWQVFYDGEWATFNLMVAVSPTEGGSIKRVTCNLITAWTSRRSRFLAGDADYTAVPRQYRDQLLGRVVGGEPIRCYYPLQPTLAVDAVFFNFDINPQSPYLGVPGGLPPGTFATTGIPPDIFSDIHVRRGFAAAFDYASFLAAAYLNEATQPSDPIISGLSYDNVMQDKPLYNPAKAKAELQAAWGGQLWANGMTFTLLFNEGNVARETVSHMLANNIMGLNENFHLNVQQVAWGSNYLPQMVACMLPLFSMGWQADYPEPDNFAFPFMHTYGTFSDWQSYSNPRVDELIEYGALMPMDTAVYNGELDYPDPRPYFNNPGEIPPDTTWPRRSIYYELQAIYVEDVPGFCLSQAIGRHWEQAWMRGWYYNPLYGGSQAAAIGCTAPESPVLYFYHLWKAQTHFGDANNDGIVGLLDSAVISASWTKPSPDSLLGPLGYKPQADLTGGTGGTIGSESGLVVGIPDGKVNIVDAALVSAYWDGPPKGPSHP